MLTRRMLVALAACAVLGSSTVFAGGGNGGSKADPVINVQNSSAVPIAAFIDPNAVLIAANIPPAPAVPTLAQIEAANGRLIAAGATQRFTVRAGGHVVAAGVTVAGAPQLPVAASNGNTYNVRYNANNTLSVF